MYLIEGWTSPANLLTLITHLTFVKHLVISAAQDTVAISITCNDLNSNQTSLNDCKVTVDPKTVPEIGHSLWDKTAPSQFRRMDL